MILNLILGLLSSLIYAVDSILPHFTMPSFLTTTTLIPSNVVSFMASGLALISPVFPSGVLLNIVEGVSTLIPIVGVYVIFNWVYNHIPSIAGFGT